jgi:glycosyltransferase involved in cell wall biosynthesis
LIGIFWVLLGIIYAGLLLFVLHKWTRTAVFFGESLIPNTTISVVIAARNEASNIGLLIRKIAAQKFPKQNLEVIIIDDKSTDETADIIKESIKKYANHLPIHYLYIKKGDGKKAAIAQGVASARHELIVTTDADCLPATDDWLRDIALFYEKTDAQIIAVPVAFYKEKSMLGWFQTADFVAMMAVTAAGITSAAFLRRWTVLREICRLPRAMICF